MAGTREGGLNAAAKNIKNDKDFYKKIGEMGGKVSRGGGFAKSHDLAVKAGRKGGSVSRRGLA